MFKKSLSPQVAAQVQEKVEAVQNGFERQTFSATSGDVKLVITGDFKFQSVISVSGKADIAITDLQEANRLAVDTLEHERSVHLLKIRNEVKKKHRIDIKSMIPEIARAVTYMEARQAAN